MKSLLGCLLLSALTLSGTGVSGIWTGSFDQVRKDGEAKKSSAYLNLKQNGNELTGTAGPDENQQWPILNGKIDGDRITFEVRSDGPLTRFDLRVFDDHIKGEAKAEKDGETRTAKLDVTRKL